MNQSKRTLLRRYLPALIGTILGAVCGYCYYRFVGCASGACVISSNPYVSTVYGGVLGFLIGTLFTPGKCRACKEEQDV